MIQESDLSKLKEQKIIPEHVKPYAISPYYALHSKAPDMRNTRVFGSLCFVWQPKSKAENVGKAKALKCIYVGGGQDSMSNRADSCWQCIDPITGREHLTYHAATVEGSSSRCTWLEKVHGTVGALRAEISSFDKSGLGCPDISTLTKQQMMTIIYEKNLTCLAAMFKDPRSPYFTLDPEDVNSSLTIAPLWDDYETAEAHRKSAVEDEDTGPEVAYYPSQLESMVQNCPNGTKCTDRKCVMMHPEGRPDLLDVKQAHQRAVHDDSMNPKAPAARLCKRQIKDFEKLKGKEKKQLKDLMELKPDTPLIFQEKYALGGRIKYQEQKLREEQTRIVRPER